MIQGQGDRTMSKGIHTQNWQPDFDSRSHGAVEEPISASLLTSPRAPQQVHRHTHPNLITS